MKNARAPLCLALLAPLAPMAPGVLGADARIAWMPGERTALVGTIDRDAGRVRELAAMRAGDVEGPARLKQAERADLRAASARDTELRAMRGQGIVTAVLVILVVILILAVV